MKRTLFTLAAVLVLPLLVITSCSKYKYETVKGDPMKTRIYTLDNGLKVYLSVNKDAPKIQTIIAVNAGGKNDPAETTGLAHYFEHLMFKGTESFGTINYEQEKPYLDAIEELFEVYRHTTDKAQRTRIYAQIDSISQIAAQYFIPNEYDKLMAAIGSDGTNAFTSNDITAYVEEIPANQVENWAKIQADRFQHPVIRGFHTELETIYEEYNMGKASDMRQVLAKMLELLFPHHPYGTQTVIGSPDQLKNPSITNVKNFFAQYYVPNNMAVIMVGDLNPDKTIALIDKYFGGMQPGEVPEFKYEEEKPLEANVEGTVVGLNPAMLVMAYPLPSPRCKDVEVAEVVGQVLTNGKTGLMDLNLNMQQRVMYAGAAYMSLADYGILEAYGMPRADQSLKDVEALLVEQIDMLKKGEFDEAMLKAIVDNMEVEQYRERRENMSRAQLMMSAFNEHQDWADMVGRVERLGKITKQDVVDFANKYLNHYAIIYKEEGAPDFERIEKPQITPIPMNRENASEFLGEIQNSRPADLVPQFVDFDKDLSVGKFQDKLEVLYKKNEQDPLFTLYYVFEMGSNHDKMLDLAFEYVPYLGTDQFSAEQLQFMFYSLAANYNAVAANDRVYVTLSGIDKNFEASLELFEHVINNLVADPARYANLAMDELKNMDDAKKQQQGNLRHLVAYTRYGADNPYTFSLTKDEIVGMNPEALVEKIKDLKNYEHRIMYFGPRSLKDLNTVLAKYHEVPAELKPTPEEHEFVDRENEGKVFFAPYEAPQINILKLMNGEKFDKDIVPVATMYNNYFGGGMSGIVFQEIREARGLAYTAYAYYGQPSRPDKNFLMQSFVGTQPDKMEIAVSTMDDIVDNMPLNENSFALAKNSTLDNMRAERCLRENIFFKYLSAKKMGYDCDPNQYNYERILPLTLDDVKAFQEKYIKGRKFNTAVLGDPKQVDFEQLKKMGELVKLTPEETFGY